MNGPLKMLAILVQAEEEQSDPNRPLAAEELYRIKGMRELLGASGRDRSDFERELRRYGYTGCNDGTKSEAVKKMLERLDGQDISLTDLLDKTQRTRSLVTVECAVGLFEK